MIQRGKLSLKFFCPAFSTPCLSSGPVNCSDAWHITVALPAQKGCAQTISANVLNRDLTQKDGWKTQDGRMTKNCRARPGMHSLARHFFRGSAVLSLPAVLLRKVCNGNTWPRGTINFDFILLEFSRFYLSLLFKLLNCIIINIRGQIENRPLQNTRSAAANDWQRAANALSALQLIGSCFIIQQILTN